jgi:hypothetical protein
MFGTQSFDPFYSVLGFNSKLEDNKKPFFNGPFDEKMHFASQPQTLMSSTCYLFGPSIIEVYSDIKNNR